MVLLEPFLPRPKTRGSSVLHYSCISVRHGLTCQELISCFQRRHDSHPRCTLQLWDAFPREQPCSLTRKNTSLRIPQDVRLPLFCFCSTRQFRIARSTKVQRTLMEANSHSGVGRRALLSFAIATFRGTFR